MNKTNELRACIAALLEKIDDEKTLRTIYRFINDLFCKRE